MTRHHKRSAEPRPPLVVHIIPKDGIGGVETAARSLADGAYTSFVFAKCYLVPSPDFDCQALTCYRSQNDPRAPVVALWKLMRMKPTIAIASLWRSCVVLVALKMLRPSLRAITFLHSTQDAHWLDWIFNRLAMRFSTEIWADSHATARRVPAVLQPRIKVVSFLTTSVMETFEPGAAPRFIFWGRLHPRKGLDRALDIFSKVQQAYPMATLSIIGPDGGAKQQLEEQVRRDRLRGVSFEGPMARDAIFLKARNYSFYLQPSLEEGAAMSVIEAMQLGLVPLVTPVGEIPAYCENGRNALLIHDNDSAVASVQRLLQDERLYRAVSTAAANTWRNSSLYKDDVINRCIAALR